MAKKNIHFKSEELKNRKEVAAFLKDLAAKIEKNEVVLRRGAEEVRMNFPETIALGLESEEKRKKGKTKRGLEIELEWVEGEHSAQTVTLG